MAVLAAISRSEQLVELVANLTGLAILAGTVAVVAAFAYRWYVREPIPPGLAVLLGLSAIAALLNTTTVLGEVIGGTSDAAGAGEALFNIAAFGIGVAGATVGRRVGDGFGTDVFDASAVGDVEDGVGRLVTALGRVVTVELPEEIDDIVGYDPVPASTKAELAGRTFVFPRRLTVGDLQDRLVARLKTDYAVGHVDVELEADGTVTYLALGSRAAGIGPTLPPATNAMAIRADPAFAASSGDLVQVWETDPPRRVLTAELRGVAGDVVTVAIDAADTSKLDPSTEYRLVTLPVEDRPDREFASLLRAADETFASVTVGPDSPLAGSAIASVDATVLSIVPADGEEPVVLPASDHVLAAGDVIHAVARPEVLRRLEATASEVVEEPPGTGESGASDDGGPADGVAGGGRESSEQPAGPDDGDAEATVRDDGDTEGATADDADDEGSERDDADGREPGEG